MLAPHRLAQLIESIGSADFDQSLFSFLREDLELKQCSAFAIDTEAYPTCVLAAGIDQKEVYVAKLLAGEYICGAFSLDPVLNWAKSNAEERQENVTSISRDDIPGGDFRERFYEFPKIGHEAVVASRQGSRVLFFSAFKEIGTTPFSANELDYLKFVAPILVSSLNKQYMAVGSKISLDSTESKSAAENTPEVRSKRLNGIREMLLLEPGSLTQREADICAHIVMGYTTLAISLNMGITVNTVATHRKRAYAKLGISSQTELFGRCMGTRRSALEHSLH